MICSVNNKIAAIYIGYFIRLNSLVENNIKVQQLRILLRNMPLIERGYLDNSAAKNNNYPVAINVSSSPLSSSSAISS